MPTERLLLTLHAVGPPANQGKYVASRILPGVPAGARFQLTTFVGRRGELRAVGRLLANSRLLTLVGPGGCGKTRLAQEVVARGPWETVWLDLAPLRRPDELRTLVDQAHSGHGKVRTSTCVVLDNCEHLLGAAAESAVRVLDTDEGVRVLATSREPLALEGELMWRVPALSMPETRDADMPSRCLRTDAVRLFADRARLAQPEFVVDSTTSAAVAAICRALDGLPLAIELAAAQVRHTGVREIARRLEDPFSMLVAPRLGGEPRHRGMRAALDWSYDLLSPDEQALFRRVAVFAGGFRSDAVAAISGTDMTPSQAREILTRLVDKSLVVPSADLERYRLLEPIREYGVVHLRGRGEHDAATRALGMYLLRLAEAELHDTLGMERGQAVSRIAEEFANISSVVPWLLEHEPARTASLLGQIAQNRWLLVPIHVARVGEWLDRALELHTSRDLARVSALFGSIVIMLQLEGPIARAREMVDAAIAICRERGDEGLEAQALRISAQVAIFEDAARALAEHDIAVAKLRVHHLGGLALALSSRSVLRARQGDAAGAEADLQEAHLAWTRHVGASSNLRMLTFACAAEVAHLAGDARQAEGHLKSALEVALRADDITKETRSPLVIVPIEFLAHLAALRGDDDRAALLSGFTDRRREETGIWPLPWFSLTDRSWLAVLERRTGGRGRALREDGRHMSVADAIACALELRPPEDLTRRELSVITLVAQGRTDKEIAGQLAISDRTAETHVRRALEKLGLRSRAELGRWAAEHELAR